MSSDIVPYDNALPGTEGAIADFPPVTQMCKSSSRPLSGWRKRESFQKPILNPPLIETRSARHRGPDWSEPHIRIELRVQKLILARWKLRRQQHKHVSV